MNQEEIISALKSKKEIGLSALYDAYGATLYGIIFRIMKGQYMAEEALQNTFLKIWDNIDSYDSAKGSFYSWMAAIARNAALDIARLKSFQNSKKSDSLESSVIDSSGNTIKEGGIDVSTLLQKIEPKYREVLEHMYLLGYSQSEISQKLDIPLGTVKTRVKKAIDILRSELKDEKGLFKALLLTLIFLLWT